MKRLKTLIMTLSIITILCAIPGMPTIRKAQAADVTGSRYEVFFLGSFPGCSATTMTFRSDGILILECIDGFGVYSVLLDTFSATFWAPNYFEGKGIILLLSGAACDTFILAGGIAIIGSDVGLVLLNGFLLSTS